ncbi:MAG TPA: cardiolipin synthase [Rhodobacteraceae bacterium]|mgnify:CR=1 FL=1|jgi:cardiolipin synthase|nr:cardiolipin synthase [Paracoccaceae bacterium]HBG98057.1 cardiolipin synthase [Paracoccaceae bacterium]
MASVFAGLGLLILHLMAAVMAFRAIQTARTPQGSVGWVVFLLAAPWFAVPSYLFLGQSRYRGYSIERGKSEAVVAHFERHAEVYPPATAPLPAGLRALQSITGLPVTGGNRARLLIDGQQTFDAILAAIDGARSYVLIQFYILRDDGLGRRLRDALAAAAGRGVTVRLLYDAVGSAGLPDSYLAALRKAGVQVMDVHRLRGPKTRFQLNFRNHRKTVVVDGQTGFIGGLNVGDEYLGLSARFGAWRDTHLQLRGPVVDQLQAVFAEDWHWATEETIIAALDHARPVEGPGQDALIVATGPADDFETGELFFLQLIEMARARLWIASPYFVPDLAILKALKLAALRGVAVRILVPDMIDHRMPWLSAFAYFDEVRAAGVEIWRYQAGFMHQKVVLVDDHTATVGTHNLDNRSFRLNFEASAVIADPGFAAEIAAMFEADFARAARMARTLGEQPRHVRLGAPVARLFAPLL